jgi:hypothetical protein
MGAFEPEPLPRDDVEVIYDTLANSPTPLTLAQVTAACPVYSPPQVYWACGTLTRQAIIKPCDCIRSDKSSAAADPHFDVMLPFAGYIGWEDTK